ncbi:MAG: DNA polymerase III subunit delta' [Dokdonella sp.]|uniref:DNA polymerase III subunit delta' n=1 Tax=Dokdonella sp. TaxID=2291710 RepID=UPI003F7EF4D0
MSLQPWLAEPWRQLAGALARGRLHHGLLFVAPAGYGKRALANALAAAALCEQRRDDGHACGRCRGCLLFAAGSHPDFTRVTFELRDDGKPRSEITIDQMRALSQRLALSSQFGGLQLALVDPADRLNLSAANALLKTLEEPARATILLLVADDPARLPATIRSRCQRIDVRAPTREEALAWLRSQHIDAAASTAALDASLGNPGLALAWSADDTLPLRKACADDLAALARGHRSAAEVAEAWAADRPQERLWFAAVLARDEAQAIAGGNAGRLGLTAREEIPKLAAWFGRANQARALLTTTVRADLLLLELLRAWSADDRPA